MRSLVAAPLVALAACAAVTEPAPTEGFAPSLAAAETAFAAQSVREGMRAAFLAWLAPGATLFNEGPIDGPAFLAGRPDPPIVLDWRPVYVEVSASGDMGLSTGPWTRRSRKDPSLPPSHGQFVSLWKRAPGGPWRVHVDLGISHPSAALAQAPLVTRTTPAASPPEAGTLAQAEARFAAVAARQGEAAAFAQAASGTIRLYREGQEPALGRDAALAAVSSRPGPSAWSMDRHETSAAGDFGYAVGHYGPPGGPVAGHYVRYWRLEAGGWRIAADVTSALSAR